MNTIAKASEEPVRAKICGLSRPEDMRCPALEKAAFLGFNFFPPSPRFIAPPQAASLVKMAPQNAQKVGLVVNPDDSDLLEICTNVQLDMIQLHGNESPARVAEIRRRFGLPVIKVISIASAEDVNRAHSYAQSADMLLLDAKAPKHSPIPGGNGITFDWRLIAGQNWPLPWMLAGGLTPNNVEEAVRITGAHMVDVASGVESAPGEKSCTAIAAFLAACDQSK